MQMQCKRIENAYAQPERDALHFVLSTFFTFRDGAYYHERCEAEISAFKAKSVKRKSVANARWEREKRKSDANEAPGSRDADADADALQMQSNSNPSGLLTNNHKPVSKRDIYTPSEIESGDVDLKAAFADWKRVRKAKKAPLTETAWMQFRKQVDLSGMSLLDTLRLCCERSWISFRADWVQSNATPSWVGGDE